jgi:pimeloyl-ACP methyl ester carboxylesterase
VTGGLTSRRVSVERDGVRLAGLEFAGGTGRPVVLLHGLAGYAGEWAQTAAAIHPGRRVVAVDGRGHGGSERHPADLTPQAFVADLGVWFSALRLAPAIVVGQSMGGVHAMLFAAAHPELVHGLVIVEATPDADSDHEALARVGGWLRSWPVPFADRAAAVEFFGGPSNWAETWADGLEHRADGLWPAFDPDLMVRELEVSGQDYWPAWRTIDCPILIVRGGEGENRDSYLRMVTANSSAELVEIAHAGHDVHLDQPERWSDALNRFLAQL